MNTPQRLRKHLVIYALALAAVALSVTAAHASHFRYGTITWSVPVAATPNVIRIRFDSAWRWSYPWGPTSPPVGTTVAGTAGTMVIRNTSTNAIVANTQVYPLVTAINATEDWFAGEFEWQVTLPSATQNYRIEFESCCRISTLLDSNNDTTYRVWAGLTVRVPPATINRPPVSSSLPVVTLARLQPSTFAIAAFDPDGDALMFTIPAAGETGLNVAKPATLSMSPSGVVTWTPTVVGLYAMQVRVSDGQGAYTPVDIVMRVVNAVGQPPQLQIDGSPTPPSFSVVYGNPVSFVLSATDPENTAVQLTTSTLPLGANMSPSLPVTAVNPSSTFTWVPTAGQIGSYLLSFAGLDADGRQTSISAQISVTNNPPTITCTPAGATVEAIGPGGAPWGISADVDDPDGGNVSVRFFVDGVQRQLNGTNAVPSTVSYSSGATLFALGPHTYEVRVSDGVSAAVSCSGSFSIVDTTAPSIQLPADITVDADSPDGTIVNYPAAIATDIADASPSVACVPPAGSQFPIGTSTVVCTATDDAGNDNTGSFEITVSDLTAPVLTVPADIVVFGDLPAGKVVTFAATATDAATVAPTVSCTPASGTTFSYGTTTVSCTATDDAGNSTTDDFTVTVNDPTPPVVTPVISGTLGNNGWYTSDVVITWTVVDNETAISSPACGASTVNTDGSFSFSCSATSAGGTASADATGKRDATAPVVSTSGNLTVTATSAAGAVVTYMAATATDATSPPAINVSCAPASGSTFPIGSTVVTCTANDQAGNQGSASFTVSVSDTVPPVITSTTPSSNSLWPPNHQMVPVTVSVAATDNVTAAPACTITGVTSNEPQNGLGDGDTPNDWEISGLTVQLRSERAGKGDGRTYTIAVECSDSAGNTTASSTTVSVPKSQKK